MGGVRAVAHGLADRWADGDPARRRPGSADRGTAGFGRQDKADDHTGLRGLAGEEDQAAGVFGQPLANDLQL